MCADAYFRAYFLSSYTFYSPIKSDIIINVYWNRKRKNRLEKIRATVYNEKEVRKILKYNEKSERDKKRRYKALFALPSFIVLILLLSENFNYIFITFVIIAFILIELIIFGLMDTKYHYYLSDFMKDGVYLIVTGFFITYLAVPVLITFLTRDMILSDTMLNGLRFFVSILLLYGAWFSIILVQGSLKKRSERWKWEVTGLYNTQKIDVDEN